MPHVFTFGVPNYFNFTFQAGPKSPSLGLANETVDVESLPNDNVDLDAGNRWKAHNPSPSEDIYPEARNELKTVVFSPSCGTSTGNTASSPCSPCGPCGTLSRLPLEIRIMVYSRVLKFDKYIRQAHRFLDRYPPIMAEEVKHIEAIDAALLRTCRTVYHETVHVLYGMNRFHFRKPRDIEKFAHVGLGRRPFGWYRTVSEPAPCGRLTMIRFMTLRMSSECVGDDRKQLWSSWCDFFYPSKEQDQLVGFPALEWLALDLTDWALTAGDAAKVRVTPFLKKLRPTGGLRHLTLIGVYHEQNLHDFKHGFVRQGGTFRPASCSVKAVATTTVTHDNLPEVSMYVRSIVEEDRASQAILQGYGNAALAV